ncbi:MAG: sigma-70 family RNA polymerase sigma factor [Bacteroidetes bacterium]|jgi:RNA polymerase sigma-70 factor (ECF subfamily)|nr:sigma-70 family RNA polymerase sigma factor [Bacteroidota bacterium]
MKVNYKHIADDELLKRFRQYNDKMAFGILFKRYLPLLLGTCKRYLKSPEDAEDLVMELYEKCADILKSSSEIEFLKTYLFVVAKNAALGKLRSKKILIEYQDIVKLEVEEEKNNQLILKNKKELDLLNGMKLLTQEQRLCVEHFYFKKMRYKQVAEVLGMDVKQVKTHLQNGKRMLKNYLLKSGNHEK